MQFKVLKEECSTTSIGGIVFLKMCTLWYFLEGELLPCSFTSEMYQKNFCLEWVELIKMSPFWLCSDNFSKQSLLQQEKICALKETVVRLGKEKETLQECVEEEREKIVTFEENLTIKVRSNM